MFQKSITELAQKAAHVISSPLQSYRTSPAPRFLPKDARWVKFPAVPEVRWFAVLANILFMSFSDHPLPSQLWVHSMNAKSPDGHNNLPGD